MSKSGRRFDSVVQQVRRLVRRGSPKDIPLYTIRLSTASFLASRNDLLSVLKAASSRFEDISLYSLRRALING